MPAAELAALAFRLSGEGVKLSLGERIAKSDTRFTYGERLNIAPGGKRFRCNFIEPGLVSYADVGGEVELLRQETIEAALDSARGNPLTIGHVRTNRLVTDPHGRVEHVGRDPETGWFFAEGPVDTDAARAKMRNNSKPSCGYTVLSFGPGGVWHNMPYSREITAIKFHHLAIVDNPRYEGAKFRLNSKTQPAMKNPFKFVLNLLKPAAEAGGQPTTERVEGDASPDSTFDVGGGKLIPLSDLVARFNEGPVRNNELSPESEIEFEVAQDKTVKVTIADLTQNYVDRQNGVESPAQKETREKLERENSQREADRKTAEERENGKKAFRVLSSARATPPPVATERANSAGTVQEQIARGQTRYGSEPAGKN